MSYCSLKVILNDWYRQNAYIVQEKQAVKLYTYRATQASNSVWFNTYACFDSLFNFF